MKTTLDEAFDNLENAINNVNIYRSAYKHPEVGWITDKFGKYQIMANSVTSWSNRTQALQKESIILSAAPDKRIEVDSLPVSYSYVNMRYEDDDSTVKLALDNSYWSYSAYNMYCCIYAPNTLILPKTFYGEVQFFAPLGAFSRGLYLNQYGDNVLCLESWIVDETNINSSNTNFPIRVDFDSGYDKSPMYLNRLYLSTTTFQNLANKLGTVTNGKLYLGSKNIANMTTTQKNAITAKGWTIY